MRRALSAYAERLYHPLIIGAAAGFPDGIRNRHARAAPAEAC
jgi:hypothetical protein